MSSIDPPSPGRPNTPTPAATGDDPFAATLSSSAIPSEPSDAGGADTRALRALVRARLFTARAAPAKIGRFSVSARLGAGGMGVVWLAHDPDLDRNVAVKLLRHDIAGDDPFLAAARLRREAQSMARLRHPNVVAVHEVGEHEDTVFLAMEYVEGTTLAQWLQDEPRRWHEIVRQLVHAGRGLQAAHDAGLVHRDFKPDNVLVGKDGRVCVTDFGLARVDGAAVMDPSIEVTDAESLTPSETLYGNAAGTPIYMAHECLAGNGATSQSDQFAFCVSLYQALWGRHPFGVSPKVAVETIWRGGPPMKPSGGRVPARIWRLVRRGLAHDPSARHPSLGALLDALSDDPAARWRRRGFASLVIAAGAGVIVLSQREPTCTDLDAPIRAVWSADHKAALRDAFRRTNVPWAEQASGRTVDAIDAWTTRWLAQARDACAATHVQHTQSPERLDRRTACLDRQRRSLVALLDLFALADAEIVERASDAVTALPDPSACADLDALDRMVQRPADATARAQIEAVEGEIARGWALYDTGKFADARALAESTLRAAVATGHRPTEAEAARLYGDALDELGERDAAESVLRQSVAAALAGRDDATAARAWLSLAYVALLGRSDSEEAARHHQLAAGAVEALGDPEPFAIDLLRLRGSIAMHAGEIATARALQQEVLAAMRSANVDATRLAASELEVGNILHAAGEYEGSLEHLTAALALYDESLGAEHPYTLRARGNRANVLSVLRRLDEAKTEHEAVLEIRERTLGARHPEVASSLNGLATVHYFREQPDVALALQERALEIMEASLGPDHEHTLAAAQNVATMLARVERYEDALRMATRVVATVERLRGAEHPDVVGALQEMARAQLELGRVQDSRASITRAIAVAELKLGPEHPHLAGLFTDDAASLVASGDPTAARVRLERSIALTEQSFGPEHPRLLRPLRALADLVDEAQAGALRARADRIEALP